MTFSIETFYFLIVLLLWFKSCTVLSSSAKSSSKMDFHFLQILNKTIKYFMNHKLLCFLCLKDTFLFNANLCVGFSLLWRHILTWLTLEDNYLFSCYPTLNLPKCKHSYNLIYTNNDQQAQSTNKPRSFYKYLHLNFMKHSCASCVYIPISISLPVPLLHQIIQLINVFFSN